MRILIVEDADAIRRMIEALVAGRGHEVVAVPNGARGLEAARTQPPDVILLDLNLPGAFDGFEVCERLRRDEATKKVPILIISAMDDARSKERALTAGATAYYTKPFSPTALLKEIEAIRRHSGQHKIDLK
jgi:DNA-binding response OmpR family regulator